MTCEQITTKDGARMIICSKGRLPTKKCATCGLPAALECDGCDKVLCEGCAVSPATEQDFCPKCFEPVFRQFLEAHPAAKAATREVRRRMFRTFARAMPHTFDCIPRTTEGRRAQESAR